MKRTSIFVLLACSVFVSACASNRGAHPMVKAAERVIDEITGAPAGATPATTLAAKPSTEKP